jgi:long-chain fatty acid transport protein
MRIIICMITVAALARPALASGGFEIDEQSAPSVGMAGAQTAVARDPAAIFYNPAGLGFQPGFGALVGGNLVIARTAVTPDNLTLWYATVAPTLFVAQRLGKHVSIGFGSFTNFGEHFSYPPTWRGRFAGYFIDITTATLQPTLAVRPFSWLSLGVGLDIALGSFDLYRALSFGAAEGGVHAGADAVGVGGNLGVMVQLVPRYLQLGFSYRSRIDMDFDGHASIMGPPELAAMTSGLQRARTTLPLPHNFAIGLATFLGDLILSAELKVSLWRDLSQLTLTLTDPVTNMSNAQMLALDYHNTWAIRVGAQYGFLRDQLHLRLGVGYDETPAPPSTLGPLAPDANRVLASFGIGGRWRWMAIDLGYLAAVLLKTTSTSPDFVATYQSLGQIVSLSLTVRFEDVLQSHRLWRGEE